MSLRSDTIRLAYERPSLRAALLPVLAREFPNTNALHDYLEEHPGADPKNHSVRETGAEDGHEVEFKPKSPPKGEPPKKAPPKKAPSEDEGGEDEGGEDEPASGKVRRFLDKVKGVSKAMSESITSAPKKVQQFASDPESRKKTLDSVSAKIKAAPKKITERVIASAKHELAEFKHAGKAIRKLLKKPPEKWTKADKKAVYATSVYVAGVAMAASGGGAIVAAGAFGKSFAAHVGIKAVHAVLDEGFIHFEAGEMALHLIEHLHLAADEGDEGEQLLVGNLAAAVAKVLAEGLSDEEMESILKGTGEPDLEDLGDPKLVEPKKGGKEASLRQEVIRLAHARPDLRPVLLPALKAAFGGTHVQVKLLPPTVQSALREVGYGRRDIEVEARSSISLQDMGGDGSRAFSVILNLETGDSKVFYGSWGGPNINTRGNPVDEDDRQHPIPMNGAVIQGHEGGGRPVYATLYVNPGNMATLLPTKVQLDRDEDVALAIVSGLKPGYRAEAFEREGLGSYDATNPVLLSLVKKGLVKATGAGVQVTTEGKNSVNPRIRV